ncbi:MAG: hypothetical protein EHM33_30895 [Chloroflexi bacterium]|nr:MAG: hypothetical protein EHM33_30895 [Chloroflexota bacterium]
MKMNRMHWIKRVLVCGVILCLAGTSAGFRAQPALAGSKGWVYKVLVVLFKQPENTMCLHQTAVVDGVYAVITPYAPDSEELHPVSLLPPGQGEMIVSARGKLSPKKFSSPKVLIDKVEPFKFTYEATQLGPDTITMEVNIKYGNKGFKLSEKRELPINVVPCTFKVHGSTDVGQGMNSMMPEPGWE